VGLFVLALTPWTSLWDRDEPRFARAALEMARSGDWLVPTFNGEVRPHKPPLGTWLMGLSMGLFGPLPAAARAVSALGLALAAFFTERAGRELGLGPAARLAPLLLALSPLALVEGTLATVDALLLGALAACLAVFARLLMRGVSARGTAALAAALAMALLVKGPAAFLGALAMSAAIAGAGLDPARRRALARSLAIATALGLLVFLGWFLPADRAAGGVLLREGIGHQVGDRLITPLESHGGPWLLYLPYYVPVLLLGFLPWSYYLPAAERHLRTLPRPVRATLLAWAAVPFCAMSLVATKLPHYVLPAFPALALAVAAALQAIADGRAEPAVVRRFELAPRLLLGGTALALLALFAAGHLLPPLRTPLLVLALVFVAIAALARQAHAARDVSALLRALLCGTGLSCAVAAVGVLPAIDRLRPVARLAARVQDVPGPAAASGFHEPSLDFALDRPHLERLSDEDALAAWARRGGPGLLVATRERLRAAVDRHGPLPLRELAEETGLDVARGRDVTLVALARR
jgi:4-amino-4-deoxy-L-arabinose transferase-like glycosyltransferase